MLGLTIEGKEGILKRQMDLISEGGIRNAAIR